MINLEESKAKASSFFEKGIKSLRKLTDSTGLIQHSHFSVPDPQHGYSLDDNARALILSVSAQDEDLTLLYLSFLRHAQTTDGKFHNFLNYKREWLDQASTGDYFGRSIWSLGYTVSYSQARGAVQSAYWMIEQSKKHFETLESLRATAFTLMGLCHLATTKESSWANINRQQVKKQAEVLADKLVESYRKNANEDWQWFEPYLTYENARLTQALLVSYKLFGKKKYLEIAISAVDFLIKSQLSEDKSFFNFIGQDGWYFKGRGKALYDQQPVEAGSMVKTLALCYEITKKEKYLSYADLAFRWFLGKNIKGESLVEERSARVHDGISFEGINQNQGAESLVSFLLACDTIINLR